MPRTRALVAIVPVLAIAALLALRAAIAVDPLDRLAPGAAEPGDPPGSRAFAGSIFVARGGPVKLGVQPARPLRLRIGPVDRTVRAAELERVVLPAGATAIRIAIPPDTRLVWSPAGRRGDPEYVPASSLSPEPPERAAFDHPGTAIADGVIALAILLVVIATLGWLARARLRAVPRTTWLGIGAVLVTALAVRLVGLGDQGATWDEDVNWAAGRNYVTNLLALDFHPWSWRANYEHPPVMKYLAGIGAQFADGFGPARALSALWSALGCALLVPIGARLYRLRAGVIAGAIAALLPTLVAHGQIVGHEAPTLLWWTLGIALALGAHDGAVSRRRLIARLAVVGAIVGVAIASRFVNGFLGPVCALIVVVQAPVALRRAVIGWGALVMPVAAIVAVYAVWPLLWMQPIGTFENAFARLATSHAREPFLGALTATPGPSYFVVYLAATLPVGVALAVIAGIVRNALVRDRAALIALAWFVIPLAGAMASPVRQDGVRYVMPCIAVLALVAGAGVDFVAARLEQRVRVAFAALAIAIVGYLAVVCVWTAPYYLDYFSEPSGGAGAVAEARRLETAWWGEGLDRAVSYVNDHAAPGARVYRDCIAPVHLAWFRADLWEPMARDIRDATWIVVYAPATQVCAVPADARRVFTVEHDGAVLAAVYER